MSGTGRVLILDSSNTHIDFSVRWFGVHTVRGSFGRIHGVLDPGEPAGCGASIRIDVEAGSIHTGVGLRDRHLASARFLNAPLYPFLSFRSHEVSRQAAGYAITGVFAIHGRELPLIVVAQFGGASAGDQLLSRFTLSRRETGVGARERTRWDHPLNAAIGDEIDIGVRIALHQMAGRALQLR